MKKWKIVWKVVINTEWVFIENATLPGDILEMSGSIELVPDPNYWYTCFNVTLPNDGITGAAMLQLTTDSNGNPLVSAQTVAYKNWADVAQPGTISQTNSNGGINLTAQVILLP